MQSIIIPSHGAQATLGLAKANARFSTLTLGAMATVTNGAVSAPVEAVDERLQKLRKEMASADGGRGVDAYIIPTEDPHMVRIDQEPLAWKQIVLINGMLRSAARV